MNKFMYVSAIAASLLIAGCGGGDDDQRSSNPPPKPYVPTVSEYRQALEKRIASPDGANINIRQEIGKFENASDEDKRTMFKKVKALVK